MRSLFLFSLLLSVTFAIRCYTGQQTLPNNNNQFIGDGNMVSQMGMQDCGPNVRFCFKSYVRRDHSGDDSHTETRSCGETVSTGKCFETGCDGPSHNRICCCTGDLCNSASTSLVLSTIAGVLYAYAH